MSVLTDPDLFNYTGPFIINSPVEWDQEDYKIDHDIIIGNGGSLVIKNNSNVEFDYLAGFIVQGGGELIIQDNTSLSGIAACGYNDWNGIQVHDLGYCEVSTLSMRDCISNVHEDGTLRVTENGILTLQANSTLNVESFGYLCVDETATLNLVAQNSVVNMETDYIMGVNPDLNITPTPNCADICSINQIGEGYINIDENYDFHYEVTIGSDQTWTNENYRFKYNLTIESGATLNLLNSSVHFANNGKIIIEKGGKLIADNSTFDRIDMCFFEMWQGIEVHGDRSWHQFPDANGNYYQGYLELNNSTIKNAKIAVNLWNPEAPQPYQTTGGIIRAIGSTFSNNAKSIHALYYDNYHPNFVDMQMDYSAYFKNCTFEITEEYFGTYMFYKHVDLNHVDGVKFRGCDFTLSALAQNVQEWNKGIAAYNSGFDALAYCTSTTQPCPDDDYDKCTFTGFYRGIYATGLYSSNSVYVNRAVYSDNALGAEIVYVDNPIVLNCDFNIGFNNTTDQTDCLFNNSFGIYLDGSTGFAIEENEFKKFTGAQQANYFGIVVKDGADVNEIYHNTFEGISYANYSEGKNWSGNHFNEGLAYFCNDNTGNYADFFVADGNTSGVQDNQGNDDVVAGNTFSQTGATWHFYNGGFYRVGYYYCDFCPDEIPDEDKLEYTTEEPKSFDNSCLSHYGGGAVVKNAQQTVQLELDYFTNLTDYNSVKAIYDSYIDGGDTDAELLDIQTTQPDDMWALRAQLLGDSPHLSEEVLKEAADRTDVFPDDVLLEILSANPDELKKDTLISYLENKEDPLPEYMIDILISVSTGTTYKTVLEHQMSQYKRNMVRACHDMIRSILNDSVSDNEELRNWLDNLGGIRADEQIIASYVQEGNYTDALLLANMLPQLYGLSGADSLEHVYYMDILNLHQLLYQQGRNTMQLTQVEIDQLADIALNSNSSAGAQARGLLEYAYGYHFPCCPNVDANAGYKNQGVNMNALNQAYGLDITVNPNPASQWATFSYSLPSTENIAVIHIADVSGKNIINLPVSGRQGKKTWDTRDVGAGVYIYTLKVAGMSKSGKIIINK